MKKIKKSYKKKLGSWAKIHPLEYLFGIGIVGSLIYFKDEVLDMPKNHGFDMPTGLNPKDFAQFELKKREKYNHNTDLFQFKLWTPRARVSDELTVSSALVTRFKGADGKDVVRPYTPIHTNEPGVLTLLIKNYEKGVMSKHIFEMKVGDKLDIKGPIPKKPWVANQYKEIGLIAGGTGITPCLQVIEKIVSDPEDKTQVQLIFANQTPEDILLKEELDSITKKHKNVKVTHVVNAKSPNSDWKGEIGHVNKELLQKLLPKPSESSLVYVCGPPGMMEAVSGNKAKDYTQGEVSGMLKDLGYSKDNVFKF